ncbi:MAG: hypothetical protein JNK82_19595 [Myxococcaceae bacterium]|nr:hypothetical protein [Myxococcaceae bacterium]
MSPSALTDKLVQKCSRSSLAFTLRGSNRLREGQPDGARDDFKKALALDAEWNAETKARVRALYEGLVAAAPAGSQEAGATSSAARPSAPSGEAAAVSLAARPNTPSTESAAVSLASAERSAMAVPAGVDPRAWAMFENFWGFAGALGEFGQGLANGGDGTMWIPGLTGGSGGGTRPTGPSGSGSYSGPTFVTPQPQSVAQTEAQCRANAIHDCNAANRAVQQEWNSCIAGCGDDTTCTARCDQVWIDRQELEVMPECARRKAACRPMLSGAPPASPTTVAARMSTRSAATPQATCGRFKDQTVCRMLVGCGWCAQSSQCLSGVLTRPETGSCPRSQWKYGP